MKISMSLVIERRDGTGPVSVNDPADETSRKVRGYAATFEKLSSNLGSDAFPFFEIIERGAFDGVLNDDVRALFNHDANLILARSTSGEGTLRIGADDVGLWYEFESPMTQTGEELLFLLRKKIIRESSFAFSLVKEGQSFFEETKDGKTTTTRRIKKIARLYDVSPVTYPAYPDTSVAVRSLEEFQRAHVSAPVIKTPERSYWAACLGISNAPSQHV